MKNVACRRAQSEAITIISYNDWRRSVIIAIDVDVRRMGVIGLLFQLVRLPCVGRRQPRGLERGGEAC